MDTLIQDTLTLVREMANTTSSLLVTDEEYAYFSKEHPKKQAPLPTPKPRPVKENEENRFDKVVASPQAQDMTAHRIKQPPKAKPALNEMKGAIAKAFPHLALRETVLDDSAARKKPILTEEVYISIQVMVLAFGESGSGFSFLQKVATAIHDRLAPAQLIDGHVVEKEQGWNHLLAAPSLKFILISPWELWKTTSLMPHYLQNGATKAHFLNNCPLVFLEQAAHYLKSPEHKQSLWRLINTHLSS